MAVRLEHREMVVKYTSKAGKRRFHGGKDLKQSQSYPDQLLGVLFKTHLDKRYILRLFIIYRPV